MNINEEEHNRPIPDWSDETLDAQIRSEITARQLEEAAIEMSQPEPIPHIRIPKIAGYLKADEGKVETALMNLADRGYAIHVSYRPETWVRVVPVEVELIGGVAWTPPFPEGSRKPTYIETRAADARVNRR
jgi:hypothetical protein